MCQLSAPPQGFRPSPHTGMGISLYSSTPSRSSRMGSASAASSCGRERDRPARAVGLGALQDRDLPHHLSPPTPPLPPPQTYTLHLPLGEDATEQEQAERHGQDEDEGEGQRGNGRHDRPEHGQAGQLQEREEVHAQRAHLGKKERGKLLGGQPRPPARRPCPPLHFPANFIPEEATRLDREPVGETSHTRTHAYTHDDRKTARPTRALGSF